MTTLAAAREELHRLHERRDKLRLRITRGELVPLHAAEDAAFRTARQFRDTVLQLPSRHVPSLAATFGLNAGPLGIALTHALQAELSVLAGRDPPRRRPPPPEPPITDPAIGFFETTVQNEWADLWRAKYPECAAHQAEYEAALAAYNARWGIAPALEKPHGNRG